MTTRPFIVGQDDLILVTGATGFIGSKVVDNLLARGFRRIRCFTRSSAKAAMLQDSLRSRSGFRVEVITGNLLAPEDCVAAAKDASLIYHLAAGRGVKSFPDAFLNSVVTTRNLLDAARAHAHLKRIVSISSFAVYSNADKPRRGVLDESCPVEERPHSQGSAYSFAKAKQDELLIQYGQRWGLPFVIVRPGYVYGPGNEAITGRVGIDTFGVFLHMGTSSIIPFSYVDNCADAIVLAGLTKGIDGQIFNVVDDDLPCSRQFLRLYKRNVRRFGSVYVPHAVSYLFCYLWERYSAWSHGQLPPVFNRARWRNNWKKTRYSNEKLKHLLGWAPKVSTPEGLARYFESCRNREQHA